MENVDGTVDGWWFSADRSNLHTSNKPEADVICEQSWKYAMRMENKANPVALEIIVIFVFIY